MKLTTSQTKTLNAIASNGGEMNGYAGQKGFYVVSLPVLIRKGMLDDLGTCACISGEHACDIEHGALAQPGGERFYCRVRLTDAGRAALGIPTITPAPVAAPVAPVKLMSHAELMANRAPLAGIRMISYVGTVRPN